MKDTHKVHIQIGEHEPDSFIVRDDETIASLIARLREKHPDLGEEANTLAIFAEDSDDEIPHDRKFCECHSHRPNILHCHRCRTIEVSVFYNGEKSHNFGPHATIRRVLKWATKKFTVDDSRKWTLRIDSAEGEILDPDTNIGKLANSTNCKLSLFLTERCMIQG